MPLIEFQFRFLGWHDEDKRKRFSGSVNVWETEAQANRATPTLRDSDTGILNLHYPGPDSEDTTPAGTILVITCSERASGANPKRIVEFFNESGMCIEYIPDSQKRA